MTEEHTEQPELTINEVAGGIRFEIGEATASLSWDEVAALIKKLDKALTGA